MGREQGATIERGPNVELAEVLEPLLEPQVLNGLKNGINESLIFDPSVPTLARALLRMGRYYNEVGPESTLIEMADPKSREENGIVETPREIESNLVSSEKSATIVGILGALKKVEEGGEPKLKVIVLLGEPQDKHLFAATVNKTGQIELHTAHTEKDLELTNAERRLRIAQIYPQRKPQKAS